jgi:hypothetical protein
MPHLSKPQAKVLAMWSFGIAMTQSSGLTTVSIFLAKLLGIKENTARQRLRESLRDAEEKKGYKIVVLKNIRLIALYWLVGNKIILNLG